MAILSGIPVLNCHSIDTTLDFYQKILQFVVVKKRESSDHLDWVHLMHGNVTIMLQRSEQQSEKHNSQQSSISLYFFSDNIKELHHLVTVNYRKVSELTLTNYRMQEFNLLDPEGNTVMVGQAVNKQN